MITTKRITKQELIELINDSASKSEHLLHEEFYADDFINKWWAKL